MPFSVANSAMSRPSPDIVHLQETDVLWWDSDKSCGEEVKGQRFHQCLNQFKRHQESKTASSNFSINIVIIIEKTVLASEIGTRPAGLSITKEHFDGLVAAFHLLPSFKGSKPRKTGYHDYIKDDLSVHNESLIFAARTPRLRNKVLFFTMRIWPPTNSMMCIITVPTAEHMGWLWGKLSDHDPRIMTCPVYLFNLLCKRLDYENEEIASKVLSTFELQEIEMDKYCANVEAINKKNMYEEHKNAIIQLNKLNMDLMDLGCTTDFEFSALGFAKSIMDRYKELYQAPNPPNNLPRISNEESRVFQDEIKSLQTATKLRQATRRHAQDRAERMVCLLSAHNHQRDMVTNQAISENSRKTSLQTRNLTILASLFIPPAYIATLFSTNIFTSNPQTGKMDTVQPQGWILAASTGGVVLVTLIILSVCFWPQISKNLEGCRRNSGSKEDFKTSAKEDSAGEEP